MRWSPWIMGALVALGALSFRVHAQEGGHGEEVVEAVEMTQFCTSSTEILLEEILELFDPHDYNTTINCLAFGEERNLESGVISVFRLNGTALGRFVLSCQKNALKAQELPGQNASRLDIRNEEYHACLECDPTEVPEEICHDPCPTECDRCALFDGSITPLCTECVGYRRLNDYPGRAAPTAEQIERDRERNEGHEEECLFDPEPTVDPENPRNFHCVATCGVGENANHSEPVEKDRTCFACGLEYCVECERGEGEITGGECRECLSDTILFEGECYACPLAIIARTAIVQEAEEAEEARQNRLRQIELAVALPVVVFLVIIFFIAMSVYAHRRYPHISHKGHKRHRKKQPDMFSRDTASPTPSAEEEPPVAESGVWRSRPTIRIR